MTSSTTMCFLCLLGIFLSMAVVNCQLQQQQPAVPAQLPIVAYPRVNPALRPPAPRGQPPLFQTPHPYYPGTPVQYQQPPAPQPQPHLYYCGNGEFYDPMVQICCQAVVMPLMGPPQFTQCCNGEVIDNRTEKCCMGMERATFDQACCGPEAYDVMSGEQCCGNRYLFEMDMDMCCQGYLAPLGNHICCEKGPVQITGPVAKSACCGCGSIQTDTQVCCGGRAVAIDSSAEACCGGKAVYDPSVSSCCADNGNMRVMEGHNCRGALAGFGQQGKRPPMPILGG